MIDGGDETSGFTVLSTTPAAGATDVAGYPGVTVTFSGEPSSVDTTRFYLEEQGVAGALAATVSVGTDDTAHLKLSVALKPNTTYVATVKGEVTEFGGTGEALGADHTWTFTTGDAKFELLSRQPDGDPGDLVRLYSLSASSDGRYVVFETDGLDLLATPPTDGVHALWLDTETGTIRLASSRAGDTAPTYDGAVGTTLSGVDVSDDGRFVLFGAHPSDLADGDHGSAQNLYRKDMTSGDVLMITKTPEGVPGNGYCRIPVLSGAGSAALFRSDASNLGANPTFGVHDLYSWPGFALVSVSSDGVAGADGAVNLAADNDLSSVVFISESTNLTTEGVGGIFLREGAITTLVSKDGTGTPIDVGASAVDVSEDGNVVVWKGQMPAGAVTGCERLRVMMKNMTTGAIDCVDRELTGDALTDSGIHYVPSISADGRYVAFNSSQRNLVEGPCNQVGVSSPTIHAYVRDLQTNDIVCIDEHGVSAGTATEILLSDDGRYVFFTSASNILHPDVTNTTWWQLYRTPNPLYVP